jgi:hypothetical protein
MTGMGMSWVTTGYEIEGMAESRKTWAFDYVLQTRYRLALV